jgi:hypothetical protein
VGRKGVELLTYTSHGLEHKACPVPALLLAGAATPIFFLSSRSALLFDFATPWQPTTRSSPHLSPSFPNALAESPLFLRVLVQYSSPTTQNAASIDKPDGRLGPVPLGSLQIPFKRCSYATAALRPQGLLILAGSFLEVQHRWISQISHHILDRRADSK